MKGKGYRSNVAKAVWIVIVHLAAVAWLVWELCVMMYPERFWEHSNAALLCSECTDKLCTQYCRKLLD